MTIKEFAHICGCNPQTLRYYNQIDLLKPVKVDRQSGYRYYDEEQAYVFVKIKNLQKAGFTIDEKQGLFDMLEEYMDGKKSQTSVIDYINALLKKYPNKYLQESTLLTGENI